ncbi:MAG: RNA polymerase sigma factor [Solirubrobacteraceae bacterium]
MPLDSPDITALYDRHASALLAYFQRRTFLPEQSVDLVGETFAAAFAERSRFRGDPANGDVLAGWLWAIARHELTDALRRGGVERRALARLGVESRPLTDLEHDRIEELAASAELRTRTARALSALPEEQRAAVHLRIVDEHPYPAVAALTGVSEQTARARVSRGLRALRRHLDPTETSHA